MRQEKLLEEIDDVRNENEALRQARQQLLELQVQAQAESAAAAKLQAEEATLISPISPLYLPGLGGDSNPHASPNSIPKPEQASERDSLRRRATHLQSELEAAQARLTRLRLRANPRPNPSPSPNPNLP